jgi:hypothetical protein
MDFKEMWPLVKKLHIPGSLNSLKSEKRKYFSLQYSNFGKSIALFEDYHDSPAGPSGRGR